MKLYSKSQVIKRSIISAVAASVVVGGIVGILYLSQKEIKVQSPSVENNDSSIVSVSNDVDGGSSANTSNELNLDFLLIE